MDFEKLREEIIEWGFLCMIVCSAILVCVLTYDALTGNLQCH